MYKPDAHMRRSLYDPAFEHDSCGVGFVANVNGAREHAVVIKGIVALEHLEHRGACGCDPESGDGAGILTQVPFEFLDACTRELGFRLPDAGTYGVGMVFLPCDEPSRDHYRELLARTAAEHGLRCLGWRDVPVDERYCGKLALTGRPHIAQVFLSPNGDGIDEETLERKLFIVRKIAENRAAAEGKPGSGEFYVCSLSCRTIVYKGMLMATQLPDFFPDLGDPSFKSALALVHSRFSTNTLPTWSLAQPFRYLAHNGEINTVRGNTNWMNAREKLFRSEKFGAAMGQMLPIIAPGQSDSAVFDNGLELLYQTGRSLPHTVMMMIPEAWERHESMSDEKRAFYQYHGCLLEPWDGPASIAFTDGRRIGAVLDRNGLRPSRYLVTKDGFVVMASETGVLDIPAEQIAYKDRLQPGRMFYVDLDEKRIIADNEIKHTMASRQPYRMWLQENLVSLDDLPVAQSVAPHAAGEDLFRRMRMFGYTNEDIRILLEPMSLNGQEPVGSMGTDTPLAVLSDKPQLVFNYFKQLFAQVTNPPIDPIREELIMSLDVAAGRQRNLFDETPEHCRQLALSGPVLTNAELAKIREIDANGIRSLTIPTVYDASRGTGGLLEALDRICAAAEQAIRDGYEILILSDREAGREQAPVPALLAVGGVHHHLIRSGQRNLAGIIVESGEPRGWTCSSRRPNAAISTARAPRKPSPTSSRPSARACRRRCRRWASPRLPATAARRSSRPSASIRRSSTAALRGRRRGSRASASTSSPTT